MTEISAMDSHEKPGGRLDLCANTAPLSPPATVLAVFSRRDEAGEAVPGYPRLTRALARFHGLPPGRVLAGNGSLEIAGLLCRGFLGAGRRAAVIGPAWGEYARAVSAAGGEIVEFRARREDGFRPRAEDAVSFLRRCRPDATFLCNPCNPTGAYLGREEVRALLDAASPGLLVLDEAYIDFTDNPWDSRELLDDERAVILRSFTKTFSLFPFRLGYALAAPAVLDRVRAMAVPGSANAFAEPVGVAALADGGHAARAREAAREGLRLLSTGLRERGLHPLATAASFLLVEMSDARRVRWTLEAGGILVRDCVSFGLPGHLRIGAPPAREAGRVVEAFRLALAGSRAAAMAGGAVS